jgi:hypothetical protein
MRAMVGLPSLEHRLFNVFTTIGAKITSVLTLSSAGRSGSPPPELLTNENKTLPNFCIWHDRAILTPKVPDRISLNLHRIFGTAWLVVETALVM